MADNFFGFGLWQIVACGGGFLCLVMSVVAVLGVVWLTRQSRRSGDEMALRREVARLQDEVDRLKREKSEIPPDAFTA
jgi:uncharacterized membrane protein YqjE